MILVLLSTSSFALATSENTNPHKTQKSYGKAGCMMCHQEKAVQSDDESKKENGKSTAKQTV